MLMLAAALLFAQAAPAPETAPAKCEANDINLPAPLAGWTGAPGYVLGPGKVVILNAVDSANMKNLPAGTKPGGAIEVNFRVADAGTYGIAIDSGGWVDVAPQGGAPLKSASHGHGPTCSTIAKIVRFKLEPGVYHLNVTGLKAPKVKIMVVVGE